MFRGRGDLRPLKHCFDPLAHLDNKGAREIAEVLYAISPQGGDLWIGGVRFGGRGRVEIRWRP